MAPKAIVLTFNHLSLGYLGCYGNDWIRTPNLDRLATRAILFDQHFAECADRETLQHAWWSGCYHFPRNPELIRPSASLAAVLNERGVSAWSLHESGCGDACGGFAEGFKRTACRGEVGWDVDASQTPFAALVDDAARWLEDRAADRGESWLLWLQSQGVPAPGIPPSRYALGYSGRFDLPRAAAEAAGNEPNAAAGKRRRRDRKRPASRHPAETAPLAGLGEHAAAMPWNEPESVSPESPEQTLMQCLYAGYVTLLDEVVGRLLEAVAGAVPAEDLLLIVTSGAGAVGGRTRLPSGLRRMCEENVHLPLWIQAGGTESGSRRQALVQTVDLIPTLLEWFAADAGALPLEGRSLLPLVCDHVPRVREYLCLGDGKRAQAIRTEDFYLIRECGPANGAAGSADRLFVKPDDVWEMRDVAAQSPEAAAALGETLTQFVNAARAAVPGRFPPMVSR